ncbi:MAG: enoyl-CoA hydratase/isomerase family protein [Candidatus Hydrogenedens sp.]|nr:enoyl-CoA hydratase/isomerase family protein [Candidatus Hydrogenedens sp.]
MSELVLVSSDANGVARVSLNRPDKRNALNVALLEALCGELDTLAQDDAVRVAVLSGEGPVFCAGLDMSEAQDPEIAHRSAELIARSLRTLYHFPKVVIAQVRGAAIAGGLGLVSACDFALAEVDAKFGYPEVRRGLVAGLVMTFARRQLHERHARELLLTGEIISGERACAMGLLNRAVPSDCLQEQTDLLIDQILMGAPEALQITKEFLNGLYPVEVDTHLEAALGLHVRVRQSAAAQEGMLAFTEKRPPNWQA